MNRLLLTVSAIIACLPAAHGQAFWRLSGGGTANVTAGATSNMTQIVNVRNTRVASVQLGFAAVDTSTDNVILHFDGSVNGSTYVNDSLGTWTNAATGTNAVSALTTIDTGGCITMRVRVENESPSVAITNLLVDVSTKRGVEPTVPIPVEFGGTGADSAADALTSLGALPAASVRAGSVTTAEDGTVTNTFAAAFSSAPAVVFTPPGESSTNSITITTTNFVLDIGVAGAVVPWIAIGAP